MSKDNTNTIVIASICGCCLFVAIAFILFIGGVFAFTYHEIGSEYNTDEWFVPAEDEYYYNFDEYQYDDYKDYYFDEDIFDEYYFEDLYDTYDYETAPSAKLT